MKKLSVLLLILVLLATAVCLTACVKDKSRTEFCYDYKGLFNEYQTAQINEACQKATKKYGVTFLVATTGRTNKRADMSGELFLAAEGLDSHDDYVIILINAKGLNDDYHFDLYTFGRAYSRISADEIDAALYSIYGDFILSNDSGTATDGLVGMVDMLGKKYDGIPLWGNIVIGLIVGLVVAGIVSGSIAKGYSRKRKNETYPLDKYCRLALTGHEDKFLRSVTTVVVINNNSSGGGSHGGGGHSSGGGFGGGHRGGR